jgi:ribonuclease BN (tRNA processing enzyme)
MKVRVLGAFGSAGIGQRPSAFLINDHILVDAGTVAGSLTVPEQLAVDHAIISHIHLDHIVGLAFLTDTLSSCAEERSVTVTSIAPVVDALRDSVFNNVVWPNFAAIPSREAPVVRYRTLGEDAPQRVADLWVTPVAVSHSVPAAGFVVHSDSRAFVYSGDTGPTDALWKSLRGEPGLGAVILECAFPNRLGMLAERSKHMTPVQAHDARADRTRTGQAASRCPRLDLPHQAPVLRGDRGGAVAARRGPDRRPGAGQDL